MGFLLNIMVWRWRSLAKYIFCYELLFMIVHGLIPLNYGGFKLMVHCMTFVFSWFLFTCDIGLSVISYTLVSLAIQFLEYPFVYNETWSVGLVGEKLFTALTLFFSLTVISMLITYIA